MGRKTEKEERRKIKYLPGATQVSKCPLTTMTDGRTGLGLINAPSGLVSAGTARLLIFPVIDSFCVFAVRASMMDTLGWYADGSTESEN